MRVVCSAELKITDSNSGRKGERKGEKTEKYTRSIIALLWQDRGWFGCREYRGPLLNHPRLLLHRALVLITFLWVITSHVPVGHYWPRCCGSLLVTLLWVITGHVPVVTLLDTFLWVINGHVAVGRYWSRSCGSLLVTLLWITAAPCSCVDHVPVGHYRSRCFGSLLATFRCCGSLY